MLHGFDKQRAMSHQGGAMQKLVFLYTRVKRKQNTEVILDSDQAGRGCGGGGGRALLAAG